LDIELKRDLASVANGCPPCQSPEVASAPRRLGPWPRRRAALSSLGAAREAAGQRGDLRGCTAPDDVQQNPPECIVEPTTNTWCGTYPGLINQLASHGFVVIASLSTTTSRGEPLPTIVGLTA